MPERTGPCRFLRLLVLLLLLKVTASQLQVEQEIASADSSPATKGGNNGTQVSARDYLSALSDSELSKICSDRGFGVSSRGDGSNLQHEDYVEAAQRCLTLEDNLKTIVTENPVLAAEIEAEIERMRLEKTKLEQERDVMLAEIASLQERLQASGVEVITNESLKKAQSRSPANSTFEEVLRESFTLLFQRVGQDIAFVRSLLSTILQPLFGALQLVWRISRPVLLDIYQASVVRLKGSNNNTKNSDDTDVNKK